MVRAIFPTLESPVGVAASQTYYVPATLDMEQGRARIERAIKHGVLRPFDIASGTRVEPIVPLWVPFWRFVVELEGLHFDVSNMSGGRHNHAVVMMCARTDFPYQAKLPSIFGRVTGIHPLEVRENELVAEPSPEMLHANDAVVVDADLTRERAESLTVELLLREVSPTHVVHDTFAPRIEGGTFCLYPLYYARYTYSGEARRHPDEQLFVAVSGTTGEVAAAKYPSAARSVAAKVRRLLSFDRRGA